MHTMYLISKTKAVLRIRAYTADDVMPIRSRTRPSQPLRAESRSTVVGSVIKVIASKNFKSAQRIRRLQVKTSSDRCACR